jgi:hypothetical protein
MHILLFARHFIFICCIFIAGTIEYKTPTAFSKAVTNSTSGGWQQVKLKSSGGTTSLFDVKRKFAGYTSRRGSRAIKSRRDSRGKYFLSPPHALC